MKKSIFIIAAAVLMCSCARSYDVCVYGGTSAGVIAAHSAARMGHSVILIEPTEHIGGMTTGGLGYTDIGNKYAVSGLSLQFYRKVGAHYGKFEQWIFEPRVADSIMCSYLKDRRIRLVTGERLAAVEKNGARISSISLESSSSAMPSRKVSAKYFIDCSYEGDLMGRSGVSYVVGRESSETYGEIWNGVHLLTRHQFPDGIDPYVVPGNPSSGLLWGISSDTLAPEGSGDSLVQAYNYRICLTDNPDNMVEIEKPEDYDPAHYDLLARLIAACPEKTSLNDWFIWSRMPGGKTDVNNRGGFSTDVIGWSHDYPEASYQQRDSIVQAHKNYTLGLLYFYGHDSRVPEALRSEMLRWGLPRDEYAWNGNWTPQLYVRESRRLVGEYVATQADCEGFETPADGIAMAAYKMDSHNCRRIVVKKNGRDMVKNEGNVEVGEGKPYPVSWRSITPKRGECENLLVPVCLSASHIAYGSIRMEPVFMMTAQAAAIGACLAIEDGDSAVQDVDSRRISSKMQEDPYMDGSQPDIIVDDSCVESVVAEGPWERVPLSGGYAAGFMKLNADSRPSEISFCIGQVPSDGIYEIYSYEHSRGNLSARTSVKVLAGEHAESHVIDRDSWKVIGQSKGEWVKICEMPLNAGERLSVVFDNSMSPGQELHADAVLLHKRQ